MVLGEPPAGRCIILAGVGYLVLGAALYLVLGTCECKEREKWTLMLLLSKRVVVARINKRVVALVINQIIATFLGAL